MASKVAFIRVLGEDKKDIFKAVEKAMRLANWKKFIKGKSVFIKINLLSDQVVPGQCTSPWIIEAIILFLQGNGFLVYVGDANVATTNQVEKAAKNWGILDICKKYNVKFVNLSKQKTKRIFINGRILKHINVPAIVKEVDNIITVPVVKTHNITKMTCALKHQWGCIPNFRHQYHTVTDHVIPEINKAVKVNFALVDATICMEENGPRVGKPKVMNSIFASGDLVAADAVAANFIGMDFKDIKYIENAEKLGLGSTKYKIVGDKFNKAKFELSKIEKHPIVFLEMRLRKIPILNYLLFKTPLFNFPAFIASRYNSLYWYNLKGKYYARNIVRDYPLYNKEFKNLIK